MRLVVVKVAKRDQIFGRVRSAGGVVDAVMRF